MSVYRTSGNADHWRTPAYRHQSNPSARLERDSIPLFERLRPEGELGLFKGTLLTGFGLLGVAALAAALVGLRPEPASGLGHSATITNAGETK